MPQSLSGSSTNDPHMKETDLHYLGGVADSEGSFMIRVEKDPNVKLGYRARPRFTIMMKEGDGTGRIRELLAEALDEESIQYGINRDVTANTRANPVWVLRISGTQSFLQFAEFIKPYLCHKTWQVEEIADQDWTMSGKSMEEKKDQFMDIIEARERLREGSRDTSTKYTPEYVKENIL